MKKKIFSKKQKKVDKDQDSAASVEDAKTTPQDKASGADALLAMKDRFPEAFESDLDRFLRARSNNVDEAAAMYEAHLKWRSDTFDGLTDVDLAAIRKTLDARRIYVLDERDADGRPVIYFCLRRFSDGKYDVEEVLLAYVYMIEKEVIPLLEGTNGKWTVLMDSHGIHVPPLTFLKRSNVVFEANYPERLNRLVMFPVPSVLKKVIEGMLHFVDAETREKFVFVDNNVDSLEKASTMQSWRKMGTDVTELVNSGQLKRK